MPLSGAIERHAATDPASPAFHLEGRVLSYRALAATARQVFAAVTALAPEGRSIIGPANRLAVILTGNHTLFPAAFAAARPGPNSRASSALKSGP